MVEILTMVKCWNFGHGHGHNFWPLTIDHDTLIWTKWSKKYGRLTPPPPIPHPKHCINNPLSKILDPKRVNLESTTLNSQPFGFTSLHPQRALTTLYPQYKLERLLYITTETQDNILSVAQLSIAEIQHLRLGSVQAQFLRSCLNMFVLYTISSGALDIITPKVASLTWSPRQKY